MNNLKYKEDIMDSLVTAMEKLDKVESLLTELVGIADSGIMGQTLDAIYDCIAKTSWYDRYFSEDEDFNDGYIMHVIYNLSKDENVSHEERVRALSDESYYNEHFKNKYE